MEKTYSELIMIDDYMKRFFYLKTSNKIGQQTFGNERYLNQILYTSYEWRKARDAVILRDNGCDMGHPEYPIRGRTVVHHINPITPKQIADCDPCIFDPENLICVSYQTHEAIHFGDESLLVVGPTIRTAGDTTPWR